MTVADLALGQRGVIAEVAGSDAVAQRLMEMGIIVGATIELLKVAPLGDPLELRVMGFELSIRRAEALRIEIRPA
jgi:Fe2+ transport system protein FeoA